MIELRPDQRTTVDKGKEILKRYNLLYMACEVRVGKSLMSMTIVKELNYQRVLFVTVKMAISSIEADYQKLGHKFMRFTVTNYEQIAKLNPADYDVTIFDEATKIAQYPKPGKFCKDAKKLVGKKPVILMSGTPTPESPSQIFHQLWISYYSPFSVHKNFYYWAKEYVKMYDIKDGRGNIIKRQHKQKWLGGFSVTDYSEGIEDKIKEITKHYTVTLSQAEAGFSSPVIEEILEIDIDPRIYKLMDVLKKDKVYKMKCGDTLVADTPAKMQSLFHQLSSGTVISNEQNRHVLDESKIKYIKWKFAGQKVAIYYKFIEEGNLIRKYFPNNTDVPEIFNASSDCAFVCQFVSGRMGVNLSTADSLIAYNIDFSATTYFQFRARMQSQTRQKASNLYWIFSKKGIERHVYKSVCSKKNFTLNFFNRIYGD